MDVHPHRFALALSGPLLLSSVALAEEPGAKKIRDNVFILEEAYNQEPGVIQHIQSFTLSPRDKTWVYSFTEEWPVPTDLHQASVTVPVLKPDEDLDAGIGDVALNYRYQLVGVGGKGALAVAPRLSLVLPTGSADEGRGRGGVGVQLNLPLSLELGDHFVMHPNAGGTMTPSAKSPTGERTTAFDAAGGIAFVALVLPWFNPMLEVAYFGSQEVDLGGSKSWKHEGVLSPAVRFAIDFDSGLQIVPGIAAPVRVSEDDTEYTVLGYLSLEHPAFTP